MKRLKKILKFKNNNDQSSKSQNDTLFSDPPVSEPPPVTEQIATFQPINEPDTPPTVPLPEGDEAPQPESGPALEYYVVQPVEEVKGLDRHTTKNEEWPEWPEWPELSTEAVSNDSNTVTWSWIDSAEQPIWEAASRNAILPSENGASQSESAHALAYYAPAEEDHVPPDANRRAIEEHRESSTHGATNSSNMMMLSRIDRIEQSKKDGDEAFDDERYEEALILYTRAIGTSVHELSNPSVTIRMGL
jgi:hypothetical protein